MSENNKTDTAQDRKIETETEDVEEIDSTPSTSDTETPIDEASNKDSDLEGLVSAEDFDRLKAEYEEQQDRMLRTIAEFENSKKRAEREKEEFLKYALESFMKDLLPTIDSIERALDSVKESRDFDALAEGIQMIHKQLLSSFEKRGIIPIEAVGERFDPTQHEAMMHVQSAEVPENRVIQEWQRGYLLHSRVIRPSMVSVSKGKGEKEETSNE
tara:strand:+ start:197 stop:838 length:642 start_codon:yes stop_codon:yes gene_type:complete